MTSLSRRLIVLSPILIHLACGPYTTFTAQAQDVQGPEDTIKQLVVMLSTEWRNPQASQSGAGIIVGYRDGRIYIATANHLVRRPDSDASLVDANKVSVQFRWLPGELREAKILSDSIPDLDLAMVVVPGMDIPAVVKFDKLGDPTSLRRNDSVYLCGNPKGQNWRIYATPSRMSEAVGASWTLPFESVTITPGDSGGTLLNDRFLIVGMNRLREPPDGEALSIRTVLDSVRRWGYPINLTQPNAVTSFHFYYKFADRPGERYWKRVDDNTWVETDATGEQQFLNITGRTTIGGDYGTLLERTKPDNAEYFIPDKGGRTMWVRFRVKGNDDWSTLVGEMIDIK